MKRTAVMVYILSAIQFSSSAQTATVAGFSKAAAITQLASEKKFDALLSSKNVDEYMKQLSSVPHHVASPGGEAATAYISDQFKNWGYDTQVETFYVLFPTPITRLLEMTGTKKLYHIIKRTCIKEDATSGQAGQLPVYNCWSADW